MTRSFDSLIPIRRILKKVGDVYTRMTYRPALVIEGSGVTVTDDPTYTDEFGNVVGKTVIAIASGGSADLDPVGALDLGTVNATAVNLGRAASTVTIASDALNVTAANDEIHTVGGFDVTSSGTCDLAGTTSTLTGSTAARLLGPTCVVGASATTARHSFTVSGSNAVRTVTDNANATALTETSLAAGSSLNATGTMTIGGTTVTLADGDGTVFASDGAGNCTLSASVDARVFAPSILIGESATGHREHHDLSTTSHRRRVYDDANALALTETCLAAGSTIAAAGTLTCSGTTSGFSGSTATNLGTTAGNTVTLSTATSTLTVNAATYNTASTTFSAYALGTMTLQAYGTALSLQCDSRVINIGNVAGTIRIQDRFPVAVTPGSAAATAIGAVTVPASSSGEWEGVLDLRNGATNHEIYDVSFSFNSDATTVTIRDFTVVIRGTTQGTIGTVVGDVTQAVAGASLTVTISCANASGIKTALTGRGRWNS